MNLEGFLTDNYGLLPYKNEWIVINGKGQLKSFWCYDSGVEYINKLENKKESKVRKKINKNILQPSPTVDTTTTVTSKKPIKKKKLK